MALKIPTFQDISSKFVQNIILDNIPFTLTIRWNSRAEQWFLTITDGTTTLNSKKLVPNWPILKQNRSYFPDLTGDLILLADSIDVEDDLTYDNLNNGYSFYFITSEELSAWEATNGLE